jgi:hypothetical protein
LLAEGKGMIMSQYSSIFKPILPQACFPSTLIREPRENPRKLLNKLPTEENYTISFPTLLSHFGTPEAIKSLTMESFKHGTDWE